MKCSPLAIRMKRQISLVLRPRSLLAAHLKQAFSTGLAVIHIVPTLTAQFTLAITLPMTTVQETSNGHCVSPPPCHDATGIVSSDLSAGAPANKLHRERGISHEPLPDRCQFTFSDSRQCTMARSDIHPSLCPFHAEREEQLFGSPSPGGHVVGAALDLPELHSACRDLTTAAGVNRALAQVFRLLAQRRISRQEAATFGHLAQLLLRTITLARAESVRPLPRLALAPMQPALSCASEQRERTISPKPAPELELDTSPASSPACEPVPSRQHKDAAATPGSVRNSSEINTYDNVELKTLQNEHLQEISGAGRREAQKAELPLAQLQASCTRGPQGHKASNAGGDLKTGRVRACG